MICDSLVDLRHILETSQTGFQLRRISWFEAGAWQLQQGAFLHRSGGFFSVVGVELADRPGEGRVYLYQPQSALTGLLSTRIAGELHVLLQARVEPGTFGIAQYGPTIQSTPANYLALHGGKTTAYVEYFSAPMAGVRPYGDTMQLDLGERYWMKSKRLILSECTAEIPVEPNFTWVSARAIREGLIESALFNIDLRSFFAVMPWGAEGLVPASGQIRRSLALPTRPQVLGQLVARLGGKPRQGRFVDLAQLDNWQLSEMGLFEKMPRDGFSIEFFAVEAPGREVGRWVQPLLNSHASGHVVLLCRLGDSGFEVLVRAAPESGLQTGSALLPSYLLYPGAEAGTGVPPDEWEGLPILAGTMESDEGGRFYQDTSRYELRLCEPGRCPELSEGSVWVTVSELKALLSISNLCSIQLRGLASMLPGCECS